ncbi:MAG: TIGR04084 family radical SAM/SPASM domain-containing protein [Nanobdellota archaeon]
MHYLLYTTEKCNLRCSYCDTEEEKKNFVKNRKYSEDDLFRFLEKSNKPGLTFYGGEPTLETNFIKRVLEKVKLSYASIVTNGFKVHDISKKNLDNFDMVSISLDGTKETTDFYRGEGAYQTAINAANYLKNSGYEGLVAARMTCCQGNDIEKEIKHLVKLGKFDILHWQLNVFHKETIENYQQFGKWLINNYNEQIKRLIHFWIEEMKKGNLIKIVPFIGIMYTLLEKKPVKNVRCGAGHKFWTISTEGKIFSCPLFRDEGKEISNIWNEPKNIKPAFILKSPCTNCNYFQVCGGRCLYLNNKANNEKIFRILCYANKSLIKELNKIKPEVKKLIQENKINIDDFKQFYEHEVIP